MAINEGEEEGEREELARLFHHTKYIIIAQQILRQQNETATKEVQDRVTLCPQHTCASIASGIVYVQSVHMSSVGGKQRLEGVTPRNPLAGLLSSNYLPTVPRSKRLPGSPKRVSGADELTNGITSYHHRFSDDRSFENKHRKLLKSHPASFRRRAGDCQNFIKAASYCDRALAWRRADKRRSLNTTGDIRYLLDTVVMDPVDVDDSMTITTHFSNASSLRSRHTESRNFRMRQFEENFEAFRRTAKEDMDHTKELRKWKPKLDGVDSADAVYRSDVSSCLIAAF